MENLKQQVIDFVRLEEIDVLGNQYNYDIANYFYDIINNLASNFDIDCLENSSDSRLQATTYITKLVGLQGYNVIIDCEVKNNFDTVEEFADEVVRLQEISEEM